MQGATREDYSKHLRPGSTVQPDSPGKNFCAYQRHTHLLLYDGCRNEKLPFPRDDSLLPCIGESTHFLRLNFFSMKPIPFFLLCFLSFETFSKDNLQDKPF